mmetsp:Transcript_37217/g.117120  ORF Transcript_37217/g.117120 Transcript_37217/m.117120 type:complete len:213 (-) Transcript_37217:51-689(-)
MRICTESHSLDADSLKNHFKHLCNRCVQVKSGKYEEQDSEEDGSMWSVETLKKYLEENFEGGESLWKKVEDQIRRISLMCLHCVQDLIENKEGCFEWFGLDYVVDDNFNVWLLECNISPDLSMGTEVLDRLVPLAVRGVFDLLSSKGAATSSWELVFCGKEIKRESLQRRQVVRQGIMTEMRAGRPYCMRDALQSKLGGELAGMIQRSGKER